MITSEKRQGGTIKAIGPKRDTSIPHFSVFPSEGIYRGSTEHLVLDFREQQNWTVYEPLRTQLRCHGGLNGLREVGSRPVYTSMNYFNFFSLSIWIKAHNVGSRYRLALLNSLCDTHPCKS